MEIVGLIALGVAIGSGLFIYNHFNILFEAQMEVTNKILQNCQFKTIEEIDTELLPDGEAPPTDWLYDSEKDEEE